MALIHWWPLNGNMKDLIGGNDLVATDTQGTSTLTTDGKIGSTYTNTSNSYGSLVSKNSFLLPQTQSMFCWLYMTSVYSGSSLNAVCGQHRHATNSGMGITVKYKDASTGYISVNTGNGSSRTYNTYCGSTELKTNKWYHVGYTYDGSTIKLYVNGKLDGTHSYSGQKQYAEPFGAYMWSFDSSVPGESAPYTAYCPQGKINDIRIYDHALSDAEARELSKCLVMHYTFNDPLNEGTTNLNAPGVNSWGNLGGAVTYTNTGGLYRLTSTTAGPIRLYFPLDILTNGTSYSFSCKYRKISGDANWNLTDWCDLGLSNITAIDCGDHYYFSAICPARNYDSTYRFLDSSISANSVIEVWDIQLEAKDHATPYVNGTRNSIVANEAGLAPDPASYANVNLINDSPFGQYSLNCAGATQITSDVKGDYSQGATASFWIYGKPSGNYVAFADYNSKLGFGFYSSYGVMSCASYSQKRIDNVNTLLIANQWNHVVVRKGSDGVHQCFINGTEVTYQTSTDFWTQTAYTTIGSRYNSGAYEYPVTGKIADFRLYLTALSTDEISRLYKTKIYISNEGDLCAGEFIEGQSLAGARKNYVFSCKEVWEEFDSAYERLEYIQSDTQAYINTGFASSGPYQIDCDMEATSAKSNYWFGQAQNSSGMMYNGLYSTKLEFNWLTITPASSLRRTMTQRLVGDGSNIDITINGVTYNVATGTNGAGGDFYIFACRTNAGAFRHYAESIKLYSFRIHDNWADVRNFIPVKRKNDGAVGLYDSVTKSFYANAGSGSFTAGPPKTTGATLIFDNKEVAARNIIEV